MASKAALVRSFYGWLMKTERALVDHSKGPELLSCLPQTRPTSLSEVASLTVNVYAVLKEAGGEIEERAAYWAELFGRIERDGWKDS